MPLEKLFPLFRFVGTIATPVLYFVGFMEKEWVITSEFKWGLWEKCYTNLTNPNVSRDDSKNINCLSISPGDSPSYYEGLRTVGCFTVVACVCYFGTFNPKGDCGKRHYPYLISLTALALKVILISVVTTQYKDDHRWKNLSPRLGSSVWLICASGCMDLVMCLLFYLTAEPDNTPAVTPATVTRPARRDSNASSISIAGQRKVTIFRPPAAYNTSWSSTIGPNTNRQGTCSDTREGTDAEFPVLRLPTYSLPPEPNPNAPAVPPPAYEDIVMGSLSPPPPYSPEQVNSDAREERF